MSSKNIEILLSPMQQGCFSTAFSLQHPGCIQQPNYELHGTWISLHLSELGRWWIGIRSCGLLCVNLRSRFRWWRKTTIRAARLARAISDRAAKAAFYRQMSIGGLAFKAPVSYSGVHLQPPPPAAGWVVFVLAGKPCLYEAFCLGKIYTSPRPYRDYITWLQQQDISRLRDSGSSFRYVHRLL